MAVPQQAMRLSFGLLRLLEGGLLSRHAGDIGLNA